MYSYTFIEHAASEDTRGNCPRDVALGISGGVSAQTNNNMITSLCVYTYIYIYIYIHITKNGHTCSSMDIAWVEAMGGAPGNPAPRNHFWCASSNRQAATAQMRT